MLNKISALIIDDERPAREELLLALKSFEEIEVLALCRNAVEAKEMIESKQPDVIFLDIEMPPVNGFELLQQLDYLPEVIFCTAYHQYALNAFEVNALDYVLKPIQTERLAKALAKLREKLENNTFKDLARKRVMLQSTNHYYLTNLAEIYLLEADGNYTKFYFRNKGILKLISLKILEEELPPEHFIKVNRSQIINKNFISSIKDNGRNLVIALQNGELIQVSRSFTSVLKNILM